MVGGISFIGVDEDEVITADYDATVIVRKIHNHKGKDNLFSDKVLYCSSFFLISRVFGYFFLLDKVNLQI